MIQYWSHGIERNPLQGLAIYPCHNEPDTIERSGTAATRVRVVRAVDVSYRRTARAGAYSDGIGQKPLYTGGYVRRPIVHPSGSLAP